MFRKLTYFSLALILLLSASQAAAFSFGSGKKGSGDMETRTISLDDFRAIEMSAAFDLEINFGNKQKVEVTIDDNLWDLLDVKVRGEWLKLDWDGNVRPSKMCHVKITVESLEEMELSGAGDVEISNFQGHKFKYRLSGAGNLDMNGEVDILDVHISGAGNADTRHLEAKDVKVKISGAGNASVYAKDSLRGRVSGVGNLSYYGDPEDVDTNVSGLGHIRRK